MATKAAERAAEEARTGAWLEELESGRPLRALVPGLDTGVFGGWALPDEATAAGAHPRYRLATGRAGGLPSGRAKWFPLGQKACP